MLILRVYTQWVDSPVLVTFAEKPIRVYDIPFPTITICSSTKYRINIFKLKEARSKNRTLLSPEEKKQIDDIMLLCRSLTKSLTDDDEDFPCYTNESTIEMLKEVAPAIMDSSGFKQCYVNDKVCTETVQTIITSDGVCNSYNLLHPNLLFNPSVVQYKQKATNIPTNKVWSLEEGYTEDATASDFPLRPSGIGIDKGAEFLLTANKDDQDYYCRLFQGYKISLTVASEMPQMTEYFFVPAKEQTYIAIEPHLMDTSEALRDYTPEKRHCFFSSERRLAYFAAYTQDNCNLECLTNYTLNACGCVEYYMPRNKTTLICGLGSTNCVIRAEAALHKKLLREQIQHNLPDDTCNCLPSCISLHYTAEITQGELNFYSSKNYKNDSYTLLHIFYKRSEFIGIQRRELYSFVDLIANCGGLLGLCCGISALSFAELFYFFTLRLWTNAKQKNKNA